MALPIAHGWIVFHPSGAYMTFAQAGAVRYAADHFFKCEAYGGFSGRCSYKVGWLG
ncbi:MAG: hypothetical protein QOJ42_7130 [Acidobacteriaceae bacterium]|nr:hypothetical protein [Acidobacteriaceae bacterium]